MAPSPLSNDLGIARITFPPDAVPGFEQIVAHLLARKVHVISLERSDPTIEQMLRARSVGSGETVGFPSTAARAGMEAALAAITELREWTRDAVGPNSDFAITPRTGELARVVEGASNRTRIFTPTSR